VNRLGSNFVVVASREVMAVVMEVVSAVFTAVNLHTEQNTSLHNRISKNLYVVLFGKYETQSIP
jgi:hypothetical protein